MERRFDLVVIGTGIASAVASRCREAGWTVAVVDYRPFGGTCALRGCIPKTLLLDSGGLCSNVVQESSLIFNAIEK